jgi:hypothetical protein
VSLVGNWTKTGKKEPHCAGERAPTPGERALGERAPTPGERAPGKCAPSPCECVLGARSHMPSERAHSGFT